MSTKWKVKANNRTNQQNKNKKSSVGHEITINITNTPLITHDALMINEIRRSPLVLPPILDNWEDLSHKKARRPEALAPPILLNY